MDGREDLRLLKKMDLSDFYVIMAFSGWPNAGRVATYATEYLRDKLQAEKIAEIDAKPFYNFAIQRPFVCIKDGSMKNYSFPDNELYVWKSTSTHNLLVLIGVEPHIQWSRFVESILQVVTIKKVNLICLLGGLIDRIPHTIEPVISGVATSPELVEDMKLHGIEPVEYSGPSSIHSLILSESERRGIPAFSIWGHTPEYIDDVDTRTSYHLLKKVKDLLRIEIDLEDLRKEGNLLKKQLDSLMTKNQTFLELVHKLEIEYQNTKRSQDYIS